jgi:hypothetical protein
MATTIFSKDLKYGDLFVTSKEPQRQLLSLGGDGIADVVTGHIYEGVFPSHVHVLERIKPTRWPARLNASEKRLRSVLGVVAGSPRAGRSTNELWERSRRFMPLLKRWDAFQATLAELVRCELVRTNHFEVRLARSTHWVPGYRATGPGLLQAVRWHQTTPS